MIFVEEAVEAVDAPDRGARIAGRVRRIGEVEGARSWLARPGPTSRSAPPPASPATAAVRPARSRPSPSATLTFPRGPGEPPAPLASGEGQPPSRDTVYAITSLTFEQAGAALLARSHWHIDATDWSWIIGVRRSPSRVRRGRRLHGGRSCTNGPNPPSDLNPMAGWPTYSPSRGARRLGWWQADGQASTAVHRRVKGAGRRTECRTTSAHSPTGPRRPLAPVGHVPPALGAWER